MKNEDLNILDEINKGATMGMDAIAFSGQPEDGWYVDAARTAMEEGKLAVRSL